MSKNSFKVNNSLHLRPQTALPSDPEEGDLAQQGNTVWAYVNAQWKDLGANFNDPMTTRGDIIVRDASNQTARLGVGVNGQVLKSDGTDISWGALDAAGTFNYIANPYAQNDTSDSSTSVTTGSFTVARTTTAAELPSTNPAAWKLSGSGVTVNDYVAIHSSRAIALADKTVGSMGVKLVDINGSAFTDWKAQLYCTTDAEYIGEELEFNAGTNTYAIDAFTVPEKNYYIHMIAKVASPAAISAEFFIESEAENLDSYVGPWTQYTPSVTGMTLTSSLMYYRIVGSAIEIKGQFVPASTSATPAGIGLPNNYTVKTGTASTNEICGKALRDLNSSTVHDYSCLALNNSTTIRFGYMVQGATNNPTTALNGSQAFAPGETESLFATVEVHELQNNIMPTAGSLKYENEKMVAIDSSTLVTTSVTDIAWTTIQEGSLISSIEYVIPVTDTYRVQARGEISSLDAFQIQINTGGGYVALAQNYNAVAGSIDLTQKFNIGDKLKVVARRSSGSASLVRGKFSVVHDPNYTANRAGLPLSDNATAESDYFIMNYQKGTWTPTTDSVNNITGTASYVNPTYRVIGDTVFVEIDSITGLSTTSAGDNTYIIMNATGLPSLTNSTIYGGSATWYFATGNRYKVAGLFANSGADTKIFMAIDSDNSGGGGGATTIYGVRFSYKI